MEKTSTVIDWARELPIYQNQMNLSVEKLLEKGSQIQNNIKSHPEKQEKSSPSKTNLPQDDLKMTLNSYIQSCNELDHVVTSSKEFQVIPLSIF